MAEFKAQILGILIVVAVFGVLLASYKTLAQDSIDGVSQKVSEVIGSSN
ncbi:MAG: hypothetical protein MR270_05135 [Erysipelotrichaceae bacterium]|nr:hypothetical protein [Erysipelotrichaceae bacterium]